MSDEKILLPNIDFFRNFLDKNQEYLKSTSIYNDTLFSPAIKRGLLDEIVKDDVVIKPTIKTLYELVQTIYKFVEAGGSDLIVFIKKYLQIKNYSRNEPKKILNIWQKPKMKRTRKNGTSYYVISRKKP